MRVLVVEDLAVTRAWLSDLLRVAYSADCHITLADSVRSGKDAIARGCFDLALIDLGLPDGSGIEVLRALRRHHAETLCVVTTVMGDDAHIVAALSAGAHGYLLKEQPADVLVRQLSQLVDGVPALSPSVARRIMEHFSRTGPAAAQESDLTAREREVLALVSRGLRNAEVARQLGTAESTVSTHVKSIYRKLGISSRAEASWHAARMGLAPGKA
jgi:DNA-binding NarL/FixJ family response regulator